MCLLSQSNVINTEGYETAEESNPFVVYCKAFVSRGFASHRLITHVRVTLLNNVH